MEQRRERSFSGVGCSLPRRTDPQRAGVGGGVTVSLVTHFSAHLLRALLVPVPVTSACYAFSLLFI